MRFKGELKAVHFDSHHHIGILSFSLSWSMPVMWIIKKRQNAYKASIRAAFIEFVTFVRLIYVTETAMGLRGMPVGYKISLIVVA